MFRIIWRKRMTESECLQAVRGAIDSLQKDGYALVKDDQTRAADFSQIIRYLTKNAPDPIGNLRAQGYHAGWMAALAAVRKMAREKEE